MVDFVLTVLMMNVEGPTHSAGGPNFKPVISFPNCITVVTGFGLNIYFGFEKKLKYSVLTVLILWTVENT